LISSAPAGASHRSSRRTVWLVYQQSSAVGWVAMRDTTTPDIVLRVRRCRTCSTIFYVCSSCDRGQRYCRQECRDYARKQQLRAANRRYQCSSAGRQSHQRRQRQYRLRRFGASVTDQGSRSITTPPSSDNAKPGQCVVCACFSRWIDPFPAVPLPRIPNRRWQRGRRGPKNYVFR